MHDSACKILVPLVIQTCSDAKVDTAQKDERDDDNRDADDEGTVHKTKVCSAMWSGVEKMYVQLGFPAAKC